MSSKDATFNRPWSRFAARLTAARVRAGMTQLALAKACGDRSNAWVVQLESGMAALPRNLDDILVIAAALGAPAEWLLFGRSFTSGSELRVVLGVGGEGGIIARRSRSAELRLHRGAWSELPDHPVHEQTLLCSCDRDDVAATAGGRRLYLIEDRGQRSVVPGRLTKDGELVDARHKPVPTSKRYRVVGVCWPDVG